MAPAARPYAFAGDIIAKMTALGLMSKQTGLESPGNPPHLFGVGERQRANPPRDRAGSAGFGDSSNPVFEFRLNQVTGAYEFRLYGARACGPAGGNGGPNTTLGRLRRHLDFIDFGQVIVARDGDGDELALTGQVRVTVTMTCRSPFWCAKAGPC